MQQITAEQFKKNFLEQPENYEIIDVRTPFEFKQARIKNSKLIPLDKVFENLDQIDWNKEVVFVCRS